LGSGSEVTINELARLVAAVAGRSNAVVQHDRPRPGDVRRLFADMSHAREFMGFSPRVDLTAGLRLLLDWYRAQPRTPEELLEDEIVHNWTSAPQPAPAAETASRS
jgi:UDP-glucose 4-epimerase